MSPLPCSVLTIIDTPWPPSRKLQSRKLKASPFGHHKAQHTHMHWHEPCMAKPSPLRSGMPASSCHTRTLAMVKHRHGTAPFRPPRAGRGRKASTMSFASLWNMFCTSWSRGRSPESHWSCPPNPSCLAPMSSSYKCRSHQCQPP